MKIAYLLNSIECKGGLERIVIDKANALAEQSGVEVFVVLTSNKPNVKPAYKLNDKVKLIRMAVVFNPSVNKITRPISFFLQWRKWRNSQCMALNEFISEYKIDILVCSTFDISSCKLLRPGLQRIVIESHMCRIDTEKTSSFPAYRHFLFSDVAKKSDAVVVLNEDESKLWPEAKNCEIIPNFTNITSDKPYMTESKSVMAMGRLTEQKGFDLLIAAWAIVNQKHPDWSLDIFGDGLQKGSLESEIEENGLKQVIKLKGTTDDVSTEYANHSFFVLSSRYEGFGLVLAEAMACGLPCVSFDCPNGPNTIVDDGVNGTLVPFRDVPDSKRIGNLAKAICDMIEDKDKRTRMSAEARSKSRIFSKERIIGKWMELFKSLMEEPKVQ